MVGGMERRWWRELDGEKMVERAGWKEGDRWIWILRIW